MDRYVCGICGYVYDPEQGDPDSGVAAGTKWEDVPDDWECPVCGASKADFEKEQFIERHLIFRRESYSMPFCAGEIFADEKGIKYFQLKGSAEKNAGRLRGV